MSATTTVRGQDKRPSVSTNSHWGGSLFEGDMDFEEPAPRRREPQIVNSHWATPLVDDLDLETDQSEPLRPRRPPVKVNSHWGAPLVDDLAPLVDDLHLDGDDSEPPRPRREPVTINSHWGKGVQDNIDSHIDDPPLPASNPTKGPASTQQKEKKEKVKKYTLNKPKISTGGVPLAQQVKYRPPVNVALIVIPEAADHTLVKPVRPGSKRPLRAKSRLSQVMNADDL
ncbi:hypothetical protein V8F20_007924 [Naviculisporaceae sp. PSN 640]